jgi:hypothetical protein
VLRCTNRTNLTPDSPPEIFTRLPVGGSGHRVITANFDARSVKCDRAHGDPAVLTYGHVGRGELGVSNAKPWCPDCLSGICAGAGLGFEIVRFDTEADLLQKHPDWVNPVYELAIDTLAALGLVVALTLDLWARMNRRRRKRTATTARS